MAEPPRGYALPDSSLGSIRQPESDCRPRTCLQPPTASVTHFLVKLALAAPASFLSAAEISHAFCASVSHFFMKLLRAAPASFFSEACALQLVFCAKAPLPPANATISPTNM